MKLIVILAFLASLILALFLWLRPVAGSMGSPTLPRVDGRAINLVPDGTPGSTITQGPPASTLGPPLPRANPATTAQAGITHSNEIEGEILNLVNVERAKSRVGPLKIDPSLNDIARSHCDDMFVRGYFAHDDPDGLSPADRVSESHRQLIGLAGENIWQGTNYDVTDQKKTAASIMDDWMHSNDHRAGILNPGYTHIGIGVSIRGRDVKATQDFATIVALTNQAVPAELSRGEKLDLTTQPVSSSETPDRFEFFSADAGLSVGGSFPLSGAGVPGPKEVPPGTYKLRFLFPGGKSYWGPRVDVK